MVVGRPAATCFAERRGGAAVVEGAGAAARRSCSGGGRWGWSPAGVGAAASWVGGARGWILARERDEGELAREREELAIGGNLLMAHPEAVRH